MGGEPQRQTAFGRLAAFRRQRLVGEQRRARLERPRPDDELADRIAEPADRPVAGERQRVVDRLGEARGARGERLNERLLARGFVEAVGGRLRQRGRRPADRG